LPLLDLITDAQRQFEICNACRYCEGYCAVFPALERRTEFSAGDVLYLSNLCHDCRACYYACPYAPPHEFAVNLPQVLSAIRADTYEHYAAPRVLARMVRSPIRAALAFSMLSTIVILALIAAFGDPSNILGKNTGPGSFYAVVPHLAMAIPALAVTAYGLTILLVGAARFWRETGGSWRDFIDVPATAAAVIDAFSLRYLRGSDDGDGCYYPEDRPSSTRRLHHSLVFYGFALAFVSTTIAAIEQEIFGNLPPYPILSLPVLTGVAGGVAMIVGCSALMWMKARSDNRPSTEVMMSMDFAFLAILNLSSITGMLVLIFREEAIMGTLLIVHLGICGGLYITAPYSKFAHVVYRFAALIRNKIEQRQERSEQADAMSSEPSGSLPAS
jgi:citrate/tricarballylate utilization protein